MKNAFIIQNSLDVSLIYTENDISNSNLHCDPMKADKITASISTHWTNYINQNITQNYSLI
jgi:hypothetical protein